MRAGPTVGAAEPDLTVLHLIHAALRRDLARLSRAASPGTPMDAARARALQRQAALFVEQTCSHHGAEDRLVWPVLQRRADAAGAGVEARAVIAAMTAQHVTLDPLLAKLAHCAAGLPGTRQLFGDVLAAFSDRLLVHLQHEERDAVPLLFAHLSTADIDHVAEVQRREGGVRGARRFLPWILEGASPADRDHVLGQLPPPVRWLVRRSENAHARTVRVAYPPG